MKWSDITVEQFNKITELQQDDFYALNLIEIIFGNVPVKDVNKYLKELDFMKEECKPTTPKKCYTINGKEYDSHLDLTNITTGQFMAYQQYSKSNKIQEILSVFITPKGYEYGKDYDVLEVQKDMLQLPITEALSIAFFFERQFKVYCNLFQHYLRKSIKKLNLKDKKMILKQLDKVDLYNLVSYPIYLSTVKQQMKNSQML